MMMITDDNHYENDYDVDDEADDADSGMCMYCHHPSNDPCPSMT